MLKKHKTKHTFQILKKHLASEWKCISINIQAVNIHKYSCEYTCLESPCKKKLYNSCSCPAEATVP